VAGRIGVVVKRSDVSVGQVGAAVVDMANRHHPASR